MKPAPILAYLLILQAAPPPLLQPQRVETPVVKPKVAETPSKAEIPKSDSADHATGIEQKTTKNSYWREAFAPSALSNWAVVLVGMGGIIAALSTLSTIRRQTEHIARQALSMRYQTTILRESAAATRKAAEATQKSVEIIINKERARIVVKPDKLSLREGSLIYAVEYKVFNYGPTFAFIDQNRAEVKISADRSLPQREFAFPMSLPEAIGPDTEGIKQNAFFLQNVRLDKGEIERILKEESFVHFFGFIKYRDVFQEVRETKFAYVWTFASLPPPPGAERNGFWMENGTEGEDRCTT
jgi:hypothetical protein